MSDVMLFGVLRMPYELAMSTELSRKQFYDRAKYAADRIAADADHIGELESNNAAMETKYGMMKAALETEVRQLKRKLAEAERHRTELSGILRAVHEAEFGYGQWPSEQVISEAIAAAPEKPL